MAQQGRLNDHRAEQTFGYLQFRQATQALIIHQVAFCEHQICPYLDRNLGHFH